MARLTVCSGRPCCVCSRIWDSWRFRNYCKNRAVAMTSLDRRSAKSLIKGYSQGSVCGPLFCSVKTTYVLMKVNLDRNPLVKMGEQDIQKKRYKEVLFDEIEIESVYTRAKTAMQQIANLAQRRYKIPIFFVILYMNCILTSTDTTWVDWKYTASSQNCKKGCHLLDQAITRLTGRTS